MRVLLCAFLAFGCSKRDSKVPPPPPPKPIAIDAQIENIEDESELVPPPKFDFGKLLPLELTNRGNRKLHLGDELREVNVLAFWASWCHPCLAELPQLEVLYRKMHGNKRVAIIAINVADERSDALKELERLKLKLPVLFDTDDATYHLLVGGGESVMIPAIAIFNRERPIASDSGNEDLPTEAFVAKLQQQIEAGLAPVKRP